VVLKLLAVPALLSTLLLPSIARAVDCGPIWTSQSYSIVASAPDQQNPPPRAPLPENNTQSAYFPAAVIHVVGVAPGQSEIDTKAWCRDLTGDEIALDAHAENNGAIGEVSGTFGDGSYTFMEQASATETASSQASALIQIGFRDVLRVHAAGTDPVPLTLRRVVDGYWTLDGGGAPGVLDRLAFRSFELTLWELTTPSPVAPVFTKRLGINDHELDIGNGEQTYDFVATPDRDLILSLYSYGQAACQGDQTFGDPPAHYADCYSFFDFGVGFGSPTTFVIEPGPGASVTAESGYTQYVPEPGAAAGDGVACAALVAAAMRSRRAA
jgi:hypothetical protein